MTFLGAKSVLLINTHLKSYYINKYHTRLNPYYNLFVSPSVVFVENDILWKSLDYLQYIQHI